MQVNELLVEDVDSFFKEFSSGNPLQSQQITQSQADKPTPSEEEDDKSSDSSKDVNSLFEDTKNADDEKKPVSLQFDDISKELVESGIIGLFEDGTMPTSIEELKMAVEGTYEKKAQELIDKKFEERFYSMSPVLQTIHKYAENGITTAEELKRLINESADYETIRDLDLEKEKNQEFIVAQQLSLSGMDEETISEQLSDLKALNKLQSTAEKFYPIVLKRQEDIIKTEFKNKELEQERVNSVIETNAINVQSFLEEPKSFLPFNIESNQYKSAIYQLAATPVAIGEDKQPIFAWEVHLKSLQNGTEEQYKDYLDTMAFIANKQKYRENVAKNYTNTVATKNFKKVRDIQPRAASTESNKQQQQAPIRSTNNGPWTLQ